MTLEFRKREQVEIAVVDLIEDYGVVDYPIDIFALAAKMGVPVHSYEKMPPHVKALAELVSLDAFGTNNSSFTDPRIYLRTCVSPSSRAKFSLEHEIGHVWLEHNDNSTEAEAEADYFSGYLLAPHPLFIAKGLLRNEIAQAFAISSWSAEIAYNQAMDRMKYGPRGWKTHELRLLSLLNASSNPMDRPIRKGA